MTALKVPANPVAERAVADAGAEPELEEIDFDNMSAEESAELDAALEEGLDDIDAGRMIDAEEVMARLRARA